MGVGPGRDVHALCDRFVGDYAALDPILATGAGIAGYDEQLTDFSPDGHRAGLGSGCAPAGRGGVALP
jgi:hypothetical protein